MRRKGERKRYNKEELIYVLSHVKGGRSVAEVCRLKTSLTACGFSCSGALVMDLMSDWLAHCFWQIGHRCTQSRRGTGESR